VKEWFYWPSRGGEERAGPLSKNEIKHFFHHGKVRWYLSILSPGAAPKMLPSGRVRVVTLMGTQAQHFIGILAARDNAACARLSMTWHWQDDASELLPQLRVVKSR